jgi:hypothetical protein
MQLGIKLKVTESDLSRDGHNAIITRREISIDVTATAIFPFKYKITDPYCASIISSAGNGPDCLLFPRREESARGTINETRHLRAVARVP